MSRWPRSRTRGRRARHLLATGCVVVLAAACGGGESPPTVEAERPRPEATSPPTALPPVTAAPVVMRAPLTGPVQIPTDPYASEPVTRIGSIQIPKLGLESVLFQGVTLNNIDRGPSHWPGSAMPGRPGNAVIAGHRATHSQPFRHVDDLVPGDVVHFTVGGVRSTYEVTDSLVVEPTDTWIADQTPTATATLYACHPPGSVAQRYVVRMTLQT